MRRVLFIVIAITTLRSQRLGAQATAPPSCSFDTAAHTVMRTVTLALAEHRRPGQPVATGNDYLLSAQAIQSFFQSPQTLRLPLWARTVPPDTFVLNGITVTATGPSYGYDSPPNTGELRPDSLVLRGSLQFRLTSVGRLADSEIVVDTPSPDLTDALRAAVKRADSAQAFSPPSNAVLHDQGIIWLRVTASSKSLERSVSLLRLAIPVVVVDSRAEALWVPRIQYPERLRVAGVMGQVVLRVLVLPDGNIDRKTVELVQAKDRAFAQAAISAIERTRFRPARIGTCAVSTITTVSVDFRIRDRR